MARKVTIDVEARFIDNVTDEAKAAAKSFDNLEKAAEDVQKDLKNLGKTNAKPKVSADVSNAEKKLSRLDKLLNKLGRSKTETKLTAMDKASAIIEKVTSKAKAFASKTYSTLVKLKDSNVLSSLNKMSNGIKSLTSKAWSVAVKIKDTFTAPLTKLKNMLFNVRTLIAGIASAWAATKLVVNPINVADAYSSAKISFSTLLGSVEGQQMMDDLDAFAKATPFNTTNVISNAQKMLAMGWDAENIIKDMEVIGNAAAATGKLDVGLESIVRALSQIKTKGRLSTEELNQLAEAGIAAKAMLAENLGYGTGDSGIAAMTEDLENGAIASDVAIQALLAGMHKYDGMMDSMANETVEGLISQMGDAFNINLVRKWGQGLQDGAKRGFGTIIQLLDESEEALGKFGDMLYDLGKTASNWAADKLQGVLDRVLEITGSFEFQNADLGGKIKMLWKGIVTDPLNEWWEGGGREKTAETAGKIGSWMGEMLTKGLLAIFGATDVLDEKVGTDAGSNIAGSFLQGFLDNFDGKAITDAFVDAIGNVWGALPWWAKVLIGGYGAGKVAGGISNMAGGILNFAGGVKNVVGSSTAMTGLLGFGSNAAISLGAGNLAGGASLGAGALSALGLGATAGGIAGAAALIKGGFDLYRGYRTDDKVEAKASKASGWTAIGGVGGGAAIGAAIGSVVPVIGTAIGALVGAGVGGIAGWIGGNKWADKIRETDDAINDVSAATADLETEQEKLEKKAEMVWHSMRDHFGDIKLSVSEIQSMTKRIVWGDDSSYFDQFNTAVQTAEASLKSLKSASSDLDKWMWKSSLGIKFTSDEKESISASVEEYINAALTYAENKHYEFTAAVSLLVDAESEGGKGILTTGNAFYASLQEQLNSLGTELAGKVEIALQDGVITLDEHAELINLQNQIAEITEKLANAETEAELELVKVKFGDGMLDADSFNSFMEQMEITLNERIAANDEAFTATVSSLRLQLAEGAITQEDYDQQLQTLVDGYTAKVDEIRAKIMEVELEIIGDAYATDGVTSEKLAKALQDSLAAGIDPIQWTPEQARTFLGIDALSESSAGAIAEMLSGVAAQLSLVEVDGKLLLNIGVETAEGLTEKVEKSVDEKVPDALKEDVLVNLTADAKINNTINLGAGDFGILRSYSFSPTVNVVPKANVSPVRLSASAMTTSEYRGGIVGGDSAMEAFARGGIVGGSTRFIRVNEESPEMIIPLSSQRRERAMKLWMKTGELLDVPGFARGGSTDGNQDEGLRFNSYGGGESTGGRSVQVNMGGIKLEINVSGNDKESIVEAIKAQAGELADYIVGQIADALEIEFENTPIRGGA